MRLSILIPTLAERKTDFDYIYSKIMGQANECRIPLEVLSICDNRELSIGQKRNDLLEKSNGEYLCFVDDDDDVSDTYVSDILKALESNPDCVSLTGIITFSGGNPRKFIHSIKYNSYFDKDGVYYRPPNHLNPIKAEIAKQFKFADKSFAEDTDWAMRICMAGVLKTEAEINQPYYFYQFEPNK